MGEIIEISGIFLPMQYYRVSSCGLNFEVKTDESAEIILGSKPDSKEFKVCIGKGNQNSIIGNRNNALKKESTPNILSPTEFRKFWISWYDMKLRVGRDGESKPFVSAQYDNKSLQYICFAANKRTPTAWRFRLSPFTKNAKLKNAEGLYWVRSGSNLPVDALVGGYDSHGPLYVIKAPYEGSITPGKYSAVKGKTAYIGRDWKSHKREEFEILCGYNYIWVPADSGNVPAGAVIGGVSENSSREPLYVGRAYHKGQLIPGKVQTVEHRTCFIAYEDEEISKDPYEVLVDPRVLNTTCSPKNTVDHTDDDSDEDNMSVEDDD